MNELDFYSKPFIENASDELLNSLFREEGVSTDMQIGDSLTSGGLCFDGHESEVFTDASTVSTQPNGDFIPTNCNNNIKTNYNRPLFI